MLKETSNGKTTVDHTIRVTGFIARWVPVSNASCTNEIKDGYKKNSLKFRVHCKREAEKETFTQDLKEIDERLALRFAEIVDYPVAEIA